MYTPVTAPMVCQFPLTDMAVRRSGGHVRRFEEENDLRGSRDEFPRERTAAKTTHFLGAERMERKQEGREGRRKGERGKGRGGEMEEERRRKGGRDRRKGERGRGREKGGRERRKR